MDDTIYRQAAIDVLDVLCQEHRYKIPGKIETYSQYNEAWQDALDRAEGAIFNLPSAQPEYTENEEKVLIMMFTIVKNILDLQDGYMDIDDMSFGHNELFNLSEKLGIDY